MDPILEMSALDDLPSSSRLPTAGLSRSTNGYHPPPTYLRKQELNLDISKLDAELSQIQDEISQLQALYALRSEDRQKLVDELERASAPADAKGKGKATGGTDYGAEDFPWSGPLKAQMKKVFGIDNFRLCQQG
jgi:ATP-dependent DNA helicase Q1